MSRVLTKTSNGSLEHVPSSRKDVFATSQVSVVEKRILMKFMGFCANYESQPEIYENFIGKTYLEFLKHERLTPNLIHFVLHSIGWYKYYNHYIIFYRKIFVICIIKFLNRGFSVNDLI